MADIVIKVGGSLQKGNNLPAICRQLAFLTVQHRVIIIPGGGIFADAVRECARIFNLNQETSHWMAILAMNQYGYLLSSLIPGSICTDNIDEGKKRANKFQPAVFLPYLLLKNKDPLPHSWDVTSDSIAAWITGYIGVKKLVLIKSKNLPSDEYADHDFRSPLDTDQLQKSEMVDPMFCGIMKNIKADLWVINGNKPEQLNCLLSIT